MQEGAPVDVFATADQQTMDKAQAAKLVKVESRRNFALNDLVMIVPADSRAALNEGKADKPLLQRIQTSLQEFRLVADGKEEHLPVSASDNYFKILQRSFGIMNCTIARMGIELAKPDILVDLPFDTYHGVYGYSHAEEIAGVGRSLMAEALDRYEHA